MNMKRASAVLIAGMLAAGPAVADGQAVGARLNQALIDAASPVIRSRSVSPRDGETVAPATLPLQVLSHAGNATVSGGTTEVRGRTAPDAWVDVQVQGIYSAAGLFGARQIHDQSLRADGNGNFAFSFRQRFAAPGTRYEITMNAAKAGLKAERQLVLFQQQEGSR